ncbi:MAG: GNAT family N-acetyltransferase [Bacteroidetes bacterium]|nr:GNAT family N-acetyltransferase [Bacteroidota bacterium]
MLIRPANKDDVQAIHGFVCELEDEQFGFELFEQYYLQNISLPHHHYLIATDEERPVGYISCHGQILLHHLGLVYEIQELFVSKGYRGQGVGRQLLQAIEALIGKEKYELLEVASNMRRTGAHEFYLKNGFERTSYKFRKLPK